MHIESHALVALQLSLELINNQNNYQRSSKSFTTQKTAIIDVHFVELVHVTTSPPSISYFNVFILFLAHDLWWALTLQGHIPTGY